MPEPATRADDLCVQALDLPPDQRDTFLDRACQGKPTLRNQVVALLRAVEQLDHGFAHTAAPQPTTARDLTWVVVADRYTLTRRLGRGGMGEVWEAEQDQPVKRRVAVKLIRGDQGGAGILARFAAERQAIALMDHPHIAKLLDAGQTSDGDPFFVMELVHGRPLTTFCDDRHLTLLDRLRLFQQVCSAVQHAHQKGVIHRDLKPSNVMVEEHDGRPAAKVIDFGLAKATAGLRLTDDTLVTAFGAVMGTPLYMAPEQAQPDPADVDTRADVYALGAILFELLTGTTPLTWESVKDLPVHEVVRRVREQEAPAPSRRLAEQTSTTDRAARAQLRELDWITLKALSKEREQRYDSAAALAADVQRFLGHEPVQAGPPSARYRAAKFVRRHRGPVTAVGLLLLTLLGGLAGTAWGMVRADEKRREAEANEGLANQAAESERLAKRKEAEQRGVAELAKDEAERAKARMFDALDATVSDEAGNSLATQKSLTARQKKFLASVLPFYREIAAEKGTDEKARARAAYGAHRLGVIEYDLGRKAEADAAFRASRAQYTDLAEQFPNTVGHRVNLGRTCLNLAVCLRDQGRREEAKEVYAQAVKVHTTLSDQFPDSAEYREDVARTRNNLGVLLQDLRLTAEARGEFERSADDYRKLLAAADANAEYRDGLADALGNLGILLKDQSQRRQSRKVLEEVIGLRERLVKDAPADPSHRSTLAAARGTLGNLLGDLGERGEARKAYTDAADAMEKLVAEFPNVIDYRAELARHRHNFGKLLADQGKVAEAKEEYRKAAEAFAALAKEVPTVPEYRASGATAQHNLALMLAARGLMTEARPAYEEAIRLREGLVKAFPQAAEHRVALATTCCNLGALVAEADGQEAGGTLFTRGIEVLTPLPPDDPQAAHVLRNCHANRGRMLDNTDKSADSVKDWKKAVELSPPNEKATFRAPLAASLADAGDLAGAVAEVEDLRKMPGWMMMDWYQFACIYSVASDKLPEKKAEYGGLAVEMIRKSTKVGFRDHAALKKDKYLNAVRDRDDFKQVVAELEAKSRPKREVLPPPRTDK